MRHYLHYHRNIYQESYASLMLYFYKMFTGLLGLKHSLLESFSRYAWQYLEPVRVIPPHSICVNVHNWVIGIAPIELDMFILTSTNLTAAFLAQLMICIHNNQFCCLLVQMQKISKIENKNVHPCFLTWHHSGHKENLQWLLSSPEIDCKGANFKRIGLEDQISRFYFWLSPCIVLCPFGNSFTAI